MKKKYFASVYKGQHQSKYRPEDKFRRRLAGKALSNRIKEVFNQGTFVRGISAQSGFTLIELLVVIGILAILAAVVIVAINPAHQFALARDTQRTANVATILDAIDENMADNKGILTCTSATSTAPYVLAATTTPIANGVSGADIAFCLVPNYIVSLPWDPSNPQGNFTSTTSYNTGYAVSQDSNGHITVSGQSEIHPSTRISVTR